MPPDVTKSNKSLGDCGVKKMAVKKGKEEQSLTATEEQCSLACGGSDCVASTFDSKKDTCTLYKSVTTLESGKLVISPQSCPSGNVVNDELFYLHHPLILIYSYRRLL